MVKTTFKGEPVINIKEIPAFSLLHYDAFGREVAKKVNSEYKGTPAELKSNPKQNQPFKESNIFKVFAVDYVARQMGARAMFPEDAQLLLDTDKMPERDTTYKDLGLIMDFSGKNHVLALNLYEKLSKEDKDLCKFPAVFVGLKPVKSDVGNYSLAFELIQYSQIRVAKILAYDTETFNNDDSELIKTGLPSKLGEGNRKLCTHNQKASCLENLGVLGLCLGSGSGLSSRSGDLAGSAGAGRVVVITGEASSQKIVESIIKLQKQISVFTTNLQNQKNDLEAMLEKTEKAEAILRGD